MKASIVTFTLNPAVDVSTVTDEVTPEHKLRCTEVRRDAGGGGINVARVLARVGAAAHAVYVAGGAIGQLLQRLLDEEGIAGTALPIARDTRESFTVLERSSGREFRFVLPGPELAAAEWRAALEHVGGLEPFPHYVVASGSLPPGVPDDFYAQLARVVAGRGGRLALDTSGGALAAALAAGVELVKPNLRELRELTGLPLEREEDWTRAARALVRSGGARHVALSLGHHGAMLVSAAGAFRAPALEVKIASTVGAGDSFLACTVWRLSEGAEAAEALRYGVAGGTAALLAAGTSLAGRDQTEALACEVRVRELPEMP